MEKVKPVHETSKVERFSYLLYFGGLNTSYIAAQMLLFIFYVTYLKISPLTVATIMLVTRVFDAVNDPLIGFLMDRFRLKGSRYKAYIDFSAIALPIASFLLFAIPSGLSQGLTIALVIASYLLYDIVYTLCEVPIFAVSMTMTSSEHERTKLLSLSRASTILMAISIGVIAVFQRGGNDNINWLVLSGLLAVLSLAFMLPQKWFIKERHNIVIEEKEQLSIHQILEGILKNDQLLIIMFLFLSQTFVNAQLGYGAFVSEGYYGEASLSSVTSIILLLGMFPLALATPKIVKTIGKNNFMYIGSAFSIVGGIIIYFLKPGIGFVAVLGIMVSLIGTIIPSLLRQMYTADCIEYGHHKLGIRTEASAFSVQTFFNKLADAFGLSLAGLILSWAGFNEELGIMGNSLDTFTRMQSVSALLPILMGLVYLVGIKFFYKINETKVQLFIEENKHQK